MTGWGSVVTLLLVFAGGFFYRLFSDDPTVISIGITYLRIAAFVQIAGCLEFVSAGTFRGLGKTIPPSIITITFNTLRVFIAFALGQTSLGLYGIFIGEASGILLRGVSMTIWCMIHQRKNLKLQDEVVPV
jgi:Na+-driven multidrug efflux pump